MRRPLLYCSQPGPFSTSQTAEGARPATGTTWAAVVPLSAGAASATAAGAGGWGMCRRTNTAPARITIPAAAIVTAPLVTRVDSAVRRWAADRGPAPRGRSARSRRISSSP